MNKAVIITARTSSKRLPSKIIKRVINNFRSIDIIIKRSQKINLPIILATSNTKKDDFLCRYIKKKYKILIFRGSNLNKIKRWYECFRKFKIDYGCIIDGDDILFDYEIYKREIHKKVGFEILSHPKNMITGLFTHIISFKTLSKMKFLFNKNIDTEMIEPFLKKAKVKKKILRIKEKYRNKKIRLTLDYEEDYKLIKLLVKKFGCLVKSKKIVDFLIANKEIPKINFFRENDWKKNQIIKINKSCI